MRKGEYYSWEEIYRACGCSPRYVVEDEDTMIPSLR